MLRAASADAPESELSSEAAKQVSPVGPVNERGEPLNTPVHGMSAKPVVGDAGGRGGPVNERGEPLSTPVVRTDVAQAAVDLMPDEPQVGSALVESPAQEALPLPEIGEPVRYFAGPTAFRGRRNSFPAIVVDVDKRRRALDLVVFYDAQEFVDQHGVTERRGGERGFERIVPPGLLREWIGWMQNRIMVSELTDDAAFAKAVGERPAALVPAPQQPRAEPLDEATQQMVLEMVEGVVKDRLASFFGPFEVPEGGIGTAMNNHDERIEALEKAAKPKTKKPRKPKAPAKK